MQCVAEKYMLNLVLLSGKHSFNRKSLHHIGNGPNPYEQAISIIGKTLAAFDEDNLIPCFGFGDGSFLKVLNLFFYRSFVCLNMLWLLCLCFSFFLSRDSFCSLKPNIFLF